MRLRDVIDVANPARPFIDAIRHDRSEVLACANPYAIGAYQRDVIAALSDLAGPSMWQDWCRAQRAQIKHGAKATAWKAKALSLDPSDPRMSIALANMAAMKRDDRWFLAIPLPLYRPMGSKFAEPADIVLINAETGSARRYDDEGPALITAASDERFTVHADARVWARELAVAAVEWFLMRLEARRIANIDPAWSGEPASALAIGPLNKIIWPEAVSVTAGAGVDPALLKKALFRQARIPHVEAHLSIARAA